MKHAFKCLCQRRSWSFALESCLQALPQRVAVLWSGMLVGTAKRVSQTTWPLNRLAIAKYALECSTRRNIGQHSEHLCPSTLGPRISCGTFQVCKLLAALEDTFARYYDGAFDTQIRIGDAEGLAAWATHRSIFCAERTH